MNGGTRDIPDMHQHESTSRVWLRKALGLALALALPSVATAGEDINRALHREAPAVLKHLRDHGCKTVGVLKFLVRQGEAPPRDNTGPLNLTLADRLEIALILANPADEKQQVGIIHNASAVAARLPGANHLTREGRRVLFQGKYPLAWGRQEVAADAFITGLVELRPDLAEMTVTLQCFD